MWALVAPTAQLGICDDRKGWLEATGSDKNEKQETGL